MKKFTVEKPTVTKDTNKLLMNGDVIIAAESMIYRGGATTIHKLYDIQTRDYIGYLMSTDNLKLEKAYD